MKQLTPPQARALEAIRESINVIGRPPTIREMCATLGYRSTNAVHDILKALAKKGHIRHHVRKDGHGGATSIELLDLGECCPLCGAKTRKSKVAA